MEAKSPQNSLIQTNMRVDYPKIRFLIVCVLWSPDPGLLDVKWKLDILTKDDYFISFLISQTTNPQKLIRFKWSRSRLHFLLQWAYLVDLFKEIFYSTFMRHNSYINGPITKLKIYLWSLNFPLSLTKKKFLIKLIF